MRAALDHAAAICLAVAEHVERTHREPPHSSRRGSVTAEGKAMANVARACALDIQRVRVPTNA